jgi:uncharacterized membrane protein YphA (DoxX/SURF4 family)
MKTRKTLFYSLLILISIAFLFGGGGKAFGVPEAIKYNQALYLDVWFIRLIGALEVIGTIGLWIHRFRTSASICLMVIMIGAIGCHVSAQQPSNVIPATVCFLVLTLVVMLDYRNKLVLIRSA